MLKPRGNPVLHPGESKTQQHFLNECNINSIMDKVKRTGVVPMPLKSRQAQYGDFRGFTDYHAARNKLLFAEAHFDSLPAKIRDRFDNDPGELIEFLSNEKNLEEAITLGLVERPEENPAPVPPKPEPKQAEGEGKKS